MDVHPGNDGLRTGPIGGLARSGDGRASLPHAALCTDDRRSACPPRALPRPGRPKPFSRTFTAPARCTTSARSACPTRSFSSRALTPTEFEVIKKHVLIGGETLERARDYVGPGTFMDIAAQIARYHHERFDGSGYCAGLRGTEIPLPARIVAVADAFDALTSPRVYKAAMPAEHARELIFKDAVRSLRPGHCGSIRRLL